MDHFNFNSVATADRNASNYTGTNYSQNILNYNHSFYKINNINNYNYIKNQSTSPSSHFNRQNCYNKQQDKYLLNDKMEREEAVVECSQLVNNGRDANGRNVAIHKFASNNVTSHSTVPNHSTHNNIEDSEEEQQNNANPTIHRSQHFTQVSLFMPRLSNGISLRNIDSKNSNRKCIKTFIHTLPSWSLNFQLNPLTWKGLRQSCNQTGGRRSGKCSSRKSF